MNKPLTAEEAKNLTFPRLLEVWDNSRDYSSPTIRLVNGFKEYVYIDSNDVVWGNAALPSPEIAEAMRKQFAPKSEYPKRMLVWDNDEANAVEEIVLADLGEKVKKRYIAVVSSDESKFENGEDFSPICWNHAKPIPEPDPIPEPEPDPIAQEIAELRQMLADLEAKYNQQS